MLARLREWWESRTAQERALIGLGTFAVAVAALWAYVWSPIEADRARLIAALPNLRAQSQLVARDAADVARLLGAARSRDGASAPRGAVEEAIRSVGLGEAYSGTTALGEGRVQVNLGVVPFDPLMRGLAQLAQVHGLAVETIALRAAGEPGKVHVETLIVKGPRSG